MALAAYRILANSRPIPEVPPVMRWTWKDCQGRGQAEENHQYLASLIRYVMLRNWWRDGSGGYGAHHEQSSGGEDREVVDDVVSVKA